MASSQYNNVFTANLVLGATWLDYKTKQMHLRLTRSHSGVSDTTLLY